MKNRRPSRRIFYGAFLAALVLFILWQLYDLVQWRQSVVTRHPAYGTSR